MDDFTVITGQKASPRAAARRGVGNRRRSGSPPVLGDLSDAMLESDPAGQGGAKVTTASAERLLLDSRDVAHLLGLGRSLVFQLMAQGELPVVRIGRLVRVPRSGLELWLERRTEAPGLFPAEGLGFVGQRKRRRSRY